jgi:hypothetical protein
VSLLPKTTGFRYCWAITGWPYTHKKNSGSYVRVDANPTIKSANEYDGFAHRTGFISLLDELPAPWVALQGTID